MAKASFAAQQATEQARQQTRAVQLEVLISKSETTQVNARAAAEIVSRNEVLAMLEPYKNDAAMKKVAEMRLEALTIDVESTKAEYASKLEVETAATVAAVEEEIKVTAQERMAAAAKAEIEALVKVWKARKFYQHVTDTADEYTATAKAAEEENQEVILQATLEAQRSEAAATLAGSMAEAAAIYDCEKIEASAKLTVAKGVAEAILEAEKATVAARRRAKRQRGCGGTQLRPSTRQPSSPPRGTPRRARAKDRLFQAQNDCNEQFQKADDMEKGRRPQRSSTGQGDGSGKGQQRISVETNAQMREATAQAKETRQL